MSKFVGFGCDGASNMMGCKSGLVTRLQECYPEVEEIESKETEIESEWEIQSNREGERDSEENRDESDVVIIINPAFIDLFSCYV